MKHIYALQIRTNDILKNMNSKLYNFICLLIFLAVLTFSPSVKASRWDRDANAHNFRNINLPHPANKILATTQDKQGIIWFATPLGLYSFDNHCIQKHFTDYSLENCNLDCLLLIDDKLYLGSEYGMKIYNTCSDSYEEGVTGIASVRALLQMDSTLFLGTLNGLYSYNLNNKTYKETNSSLPNSIIYSLASDDKGTLFVGTYDGLYSIRNNQITEIKIPEKSNNIFVNSLLWDSNSKNLLIGTEKNLFTYNTSTKSVKQINSINNNSVKSILLANNNKLYIATDNGLYIATNNSDGTYSIEHTSHDSRNNKSLCNNVIWNVFEDRDNNIWLGTNYGVSLKESTDNYSLLSLYDITQSAYGNQLTTIQETSNKTLFLGGINGLIELTPQSNSMYNCTPLPLLQFL